MSNVAIRSNRIQCLLALVSASVVVICVFIGVTMNLTTLYDENFDHMGIRTFCMFTVDSNIFAAFSTMLCIPYTVDGLRAGYYHLPDWVVVLMHVAVTAVTLTFLVSLFILAPVKGFVLIFTGSRFFLHGVCPILSIITLCFFIESHIIRLKESLFSLIPVAIYTLIYLVMVVFVGEEKGGWNDFYGFATRIPVWIPLLLILPLTFGIATLVRLLHNRFCLINRKIDIGLYRKVYAGTDIRKGITDLARASRQGSLSKRIVVPAQIIEYMIQGSGSDLDPAEGCRIYMEAYLKDV